MLLWLFTVGVFGQTAIFVSVSGNDSNGGTSWSNAKKTLAGALEAVSGPTHIYMKVGNYTCANVLIPNLVTVTGGYASISSGTDTTQRRYPGINANWTQTTLCTILDGDNASRVATVNAGGKLEGCVITHGAVNGNGGGVLINGGTVQHCAIIHNSAHNNANELNGNGGGAYVQNNGLLLNCVVAFNTAINGPGVAGTDGTLTNNTITENAAIVLPIVTTSVVADITTTTASCGGNVISDGGSSVTSRGVCWSTSHNPTISNSHTSNGTGTGDFASNLTGLSPNTTYYVRAYATNILGIAYGNEVLFTTLQGGQPCNGVPTVSDYDGNTYNTVQIGNQCWMKENLRTTHYANGTSIALGSTTSTTTAYRYYPGNNSSNVVIYGYLYNWKAVMRNSSSSDANPSGVQGVCPTGWHVPSKVEWDQLRQYVSRQNEYLCGGNNSTIIAKAFSATTGWYSSSDNCDVGNDLSANNATGFSALPAGEYYSNYSGFGKGAEIWSATEANSTDPYSFHLWYDTGSVMYAISSKANGYSVRCVRN